MMLLLAAVAAGSATADTGGAAAGEPSAAASSDSTAATGGAQYGASGGTATSTVERPVVDGYRATLLPDGRAAAPSMAPAAVQEAIWAANEIVGMPYVYGGGHNRTFRSRGYDCSGTISYALHGARLLRSPLDSSSFAHWARRGPGAWITVWTNPRHAFVVIAGLRLDTSAAGDPSGAKGPRWRPVLRSTRGYVARHPVAL